MTRLLLLAILMQGPTSQQIGVVIGHVIRGATPSSAGIPVIARTLEGALAAVTETDENGGYRFALRPGRYLMSAGLPSSPTYYPGAIESVDAEPITVRNGSTIIGINFPLVNPIDIQVTGRVIIEGGGDLPLDAAEMIGAAALNSVPRPTALMRMISQRIFGGIRASTTVRADGFFSLTLQPGENHIFVQSLPMGYYVRSIFAGTQDILLAPLNITEGALPEVVVTLTRTPPPSNPPVVTVAGRVTGLPSETAARWIMLQSAPSPFGVPAMIAEVPLQADGSFEVRGVPPGDYTVSPLQTALPTSSRVSLFVPPEGVRGFEVAWANPRAPRNLLALETPPVFNVSGKVETVPGAVVPSTVRLVARWLPRASKEVRVGMDGTFGFADVLQGEYELRIGRDPLTVTRHFNVPNQDVSGIEIKSAVPVLGRVVMNDGSRLTMSDFQIQSEHTAGNPGNTRTLPTIQREFEVQNDGTFTIGALSGEQRISVLGLPVAYSVKSMTYGSTDLVANKLSLHSLPESEIVVTLEKTGVPDPNFSFVYQVGHGSFDHPTAIDTVRGTFTKDMIVDPARIFQFRLSDAQLSEIEKKLDAIDFWNSTKYPSVFTMPNPGTTGCMTTSRQPMFLWVKRGEVLKELTWMDQDTLCTPNDAGRDLRSLKELIRQILVATPVSPSPPAPRGMLID